MYYLLLAPIFVGSFVFIAFKKCASSKSWFLSTLSFHWPVFFLSSVCFEHGNTQQWSPVTPERTGQLWRQGYGQPTNHSRWGHFVHNWKLYFRRNWRINRYCTDFLQGFFCTTKLFVKNFTIWLKISLKRSFQRPDLMSQKLDSASSQRKSPFWVCG